MAQYFDNVEELGHQDITVDFTLLGETYHFKSDRGVFSKRGLDDGTRILLETIANLSLGRKILDLGCGVGPIGLILAHLDPNKFITLADVNLRALELSKKNADILGVSSQVEIVNSDVYLNINSIYDTIISNPPIRAGKKVTYKIYDEAGEHLTKDGSLIIVIRVKQGAQSVKEHLLSLFNKVEVLEKKKGYLVIQASDKKELY